MRFSPVRLCTYFKNFPKSYIDHEKGILPEFVSNNRFGARPVYQYRRKPGQYVANEYRPWELKNKLVNKDALQEFIGNRYNPKAMYVKPSVHDQKTFVKHRLNQQFTPPIKDEKWLYFRGDKVQIMVGKDKGKQGIINYIVRDRNWVFVKGLNTKYERFGERKGHAGSIQCREQPLDVYLREVSLLDPVDSMPTRVQWRFTAEGERVRVSTRTGHELPLAPVAFSTYEYSSPENYSESEKDTVSKIALDVSYQPSNKTFEDEVMESLKIVDHRKMGKTYWYTTCTKPEPTKQFYYVNVLVM